MPTQDMKLPLAAYARNTLRNVENLYNEELIERVFADGSIPEDKLQAGPDAVYVAAITQTGTNAPVVTEIKNTTGATVTPAYVGVGDYTLTFDSAVLTAAKTRVSLDQGTGQDLASVAKAYASSTTVVQVLTGSDSSTPANAELTAAILRVEIYV